MFQQPIPNISVSLYSLLLLFYNHLEFDNPESDREQTKMPIMGYEDDRKQY